MHFLHLEVSLVKSDLYSKRKVNVDQYLDNVHVHIYQDNDYTKARGIQVSIAL